MYPANNPNYSFPWGLPQPNQNQNPFSPSDQFANNFAKDALPTSNDNSFQQGTNAYYPSPWNANNYPPPPYENRWNQWIPPLSSPLASQKPPPQSEQSTFDLRQLLVLNRHQRQDLRSPSVNSVITGSTTQFKQQVPATKSSHTSQPKELGPTDTFEMSLLRNNHTSLPIGKTSKSVRPHFLKFKALLKEFVLDRYPSRIFDGLVKQLIMCSKEANYIREIRNFIKQNLIIGVKPWSVATEYVPPHLRMRILWLLGEICRPEYDAHLRYVREILKVDELFQEFMSKYTVEKDYIAELQAIWSYWKSYVPKNVINKVAESCLNLNKRVIVNPIPDHSALQRNSPNVYGNATLEKPVPIVFEIDNTFEKKKKAPKHKFGDVMSPLVVQNRNQSTSIERSHVFPHNYNWPATFLPSSTSITTEKPKPISYVKPQESINIDTKVAKFLSLVDKLVTVDRSDVPKAASELLYCFLENGSDLKLSYRIGKGTMNRLQEVQFAMLRRCTDFHLKMYSGQH